MMHIAADFILQGNRLYKLKASKTGFLLAHVGIYTIFFIVFSPLLLELTFVQGLVFSAINGGAHLIVDFFTSKFKKLYWQKNEAKYIAVISIDHVLHISILMGTYIYMYPQLLAG
ncbi:MAG TPA: DUF3307 domain-containing protein [Paludibacteraceae bacterium]|nr:DUF3307 domain-containing protein [Paludibacteraceae bacterium]